jgi:hypothetical protein
VTPSEVKELVAIMVAAFPAARVSRRTIEVYQSELASVDRDLANRAVRRLIRTSRYLPTVSDVLHTVADITDGPLPLALEAWATVCCEAQGRPGPREWSDPVTAECVAAMGWQYLRRSCNDAADRARFCSLYDELAKRRRDDVVAGSELPRKQLAAKRRPMLRAGRGNDE